MPTGGAAGAASLHGAFGCLADPTRRAIIARLQGGEATVSQLARPLQARLPVFLKHLGVLEQAGLVTTRKVGRTRVVALRPEALADALAFLEAVRWAAVPRFDAKASYIDLSDMDVT